jgi:hypothetical protein
MEVIDRESDSWTLLVDRANYYLDVRCRVGVYYPHLLIKLDYAELRQFVFLGRNFIESLARRVQRWPQEFYERNEPVEVQRKVALAAPTPSTVPKVIKLAR